jgi:hypothetical protein
MSKTHLVLDCGVTRLGVIYVSHALKTEEKPR